MIRITCTSCQKPLSLDETKLPMREVSFPCPVCKAKLSVDRRTFEGGEAAPAAPVAPAVTMSVAPDEPDDDDDNENAFGSKALMVGNDNAGVRQAAKLMGFLPVYHADPARAREFFNQEIPQVVFLIPPQLTPPPLEAMAPVISVIPSDRRKSFFILVADNLRTLDGNAAFLYGVNLVVAAKDVGQLPQIFREAHVVHERAYAAMNAVIRERQLA
jgi:hypothetical protein